MMLNIQIESQSCGLTESRLHQPGTYRFTKLDGLWKVDRL